ncbi:hypothetical protein [Paenibacillus alvei]|uniref:hypothetical protein n=1 Tax=Paenibacillus alvei TaxID=44250 RepID=UPI0022816BFB|nr:hypothetical protein [Paenibacillus alvei]
MHKFFGMFQIGQLNVTPKAKLIDPRVLHAALCRHMAGDWGSVCQDDMLANDEALRTGEERLFSIYESNGQVFWIITNEERTVTMILLPDEN